MNNENLIKKEKQILSNIKEIHEHHTYLLNNHLKPIQLESQSNDLQEPTAFPTPNHLYKQYINKSIKKQTVPESTREK